MCVIMVAQNKRLSQKMVVKAMTKNPDGVGFAWLDGGKVRYSKGISQTDEIHKMRKTLPLPYVFHARYATEGKTVPQLCHPFPVTVKDSRRTAGRCSKVLFHNGTWSKWKDTAQNVEGRYGCSLPKGDMSDSRAMAFVVSVVGEGVLDMPHGQRFLIMDKDGPELFGRGWVKYNGFWVSNTRWTDPPKTAQAKLFSRPSQPTAHGPVNGQIREDLIALAQGRLVTGNTLQVTDKRKYQTPNKADRWKGLERLGVMPIAPTDPVGDVVTSDLGKRITDWDANGQPVGNDLLSWYDDWRRRQQEDVGETIDAHADDFTEHPIDE